MKTTMITRKAGTVSVFVSVLFIFSFFLSACEDRCKHFACQGVPAAPETASSSSSGDPLAGVSDDAVRVAPNKGYHREDGEREETGAVDTAGAYTRRGWDKVKYWTKAVFWFILVILATPAVFVGTLRMAVKENEGLAEAALCGVAATILAVLSWGNPAGGYFFFLSMILPGIVAGLTEGKGGWKWAAWAGMVVVYLLILYFR